VVHLFEDVVVSLDKSARIITWHASSGEILSEMNSEGTKSINLARIDEHLLMLSCNGGTIHVVSHVEVKKIKSVPLRNLGKVSKVKIAIHGGISSLTVIAKLPSCGIPIRSRSWAN